MSEKKMGAKRLPFVLISSAAVAAATTIAAAAAAVTTSAIPAAAAAAATVSPVATSTIAASASAAASISSAAATTTPVAAAAIAAATAASISSAAAAPVTTVTAAALATAAAGFIRLFDSHFLAADGRIVQCLDRPAGLRLIGHIDKPEAFTLPRFPIHHHFRKIHCSIQFKHFFQVRIVKITGKTCYKKLHADRFKR